MKTHLLAMGMLLAAGLTVGVESLDAANTPKPPSAKKFETLANSALEAMKQKAAKLKITGIAVVCYSPGDAVQGWTSKMAVVGRMKDVPTATDKGSNLLAIAYSKAAEMADTLENSGTAKRAPMTGEFGWQGGAVARVKAGYVIVAFSGGKSEDDFKVSTAGLDALKPGI